MADFNGLAGKFRLQKNSNSVAPAKVIKRPRDSLVCDQCRRSKLRCDRGRPCGSCLKRHETPIVCEYTQTTRPDRDRQRNALAEDRLQRLESKVKELMATQPSTEPQLNFISSQPTPPTEPEAAINAVNLSGSELGANKPYVGSTHWSAILDDIHELKTALADNADALDAEEELVVTDPPLGSEVIFGSATGYSLQQIIADYLPSRIETDRLLATYFRGETFIFPFIHTFQFQRKYREFWDDATNVKPLWLSQLFSICCLSTMVTKVNASQRPSENDESVVLHMAAGQCLVLGEYQKPQEYGVEAIALYALSKNYRSYDPSRQAGAILSLAMRMAYEMGYHRDPDSFGKFTVFEGEMRRRFWAVCKQVDLMVNFQLGLPSNLRLENCDTKSPRNLQDSDFDTDTQILPPSRPEDEATQILWFIVKDRQMPSFSKVCQDLLSFKERSTEEIMTLDLEIRQMYATTPDILRNRPVSESIHDSPFLILTRVYIEHIYLKSLCVLHRKYMARRNDISTQCCVDAAKKLVSTFLEVYREVMPGGLLHTARWMLNNFTLNDFHLATMVLCLFIHTRHKHKDSSMETLVRSDGTAIEQEVHELLRQAQAVCMEISSLSKDAWRVSHAVRLTLRDVQPPGIKANKQGWIHSPTSLSTAFTATDTKIEETQYSDPTALASHLSNGNAQYDETIFGSLDPFNFTGVDNDGIDWTMLNQQILDLDS